MSFPLASTSPEAAPRGAATRILVLGDSLAEGYGLDPSEAFPALLEKKLRAAGKNVEVINAGVSGSTTASGPSRLRWHLQSKPDWLLLALGANDGLRGLDAAVTKKNLAESIRMAQQAGVRVLLAGMRMPPNYGPYAARFEAIYRELAKELKVPLVPFLLDKVAGEQDLNLGDGIHPNAKGQAVIAETIYRAVSPLL